MNCPNCGSNATVLVWESQAAHDEGDEPDYVGCFKCGEMESHGALTT